MAAMKQWTWQGPGWVLPEKLGGGVWPACQNPTLFMTKICDFSYLIMANTADTVPLKIIYAGILLMVLSTMMKKQLLLKNILDWKLDCKKQYTLFMTKINTLFTNIGLG